MTLLTVGQTFCKEVRILGDYNVDIARVIGWEGRGKVEVSEIYGSGSLEGEDEGGAAEAA